jgi:hypothetical protein
MGKVIFKPGVDKKYTATVEGSSEVFSLPEVQKSGINLKIQNEKGGKTFTLSRSKTEKEKYQKIKLVAQVNNIVVFENEIDFENFLSVKGHLGTESLPSGILHFTIFSSEGIPLAERLAFLNNQEYKVTGSVDLVKKGLTKRAENIPGI